MDLFRRYRLFILAITLVTFFLGRGQALAQDSAAPSGKVAASLQAFVEEHQLAGAVTLVASRDRVLSLETVGYADIAAKKPMQKDSLFWIASMSKAITAAGLMILVDEGKVKLDDPVEKYLPEFKVQQVMVAREGNAITLKKPNSLVTVRQVLSHISGLPFKSVIEQPTLDVYTLQERSVSYAMTPLASEPGTRFQYSNAGINTAGALIEVVSGMPFDRFMDQRLLGPLGMKDTTFWPNEDQLSRLAQSYRPNESKDGLQAVPITQLAYPLSDRKHRTVMPAGGYFSTARDVGRFCQMLLGGGELEGKRILSKEAVHEMSSSHTDRAAGLDAKQRGYGLGLFVYKQPGGPLASLSPGSYGHGGAYQTQMWIDPTKGRVMVLLVHHASFPAGVSAKLHEAFLKAAVVAKEAP